MTCGVGDSVAISVRLTMDLVSILLCQVTCVIVQAMMCTCCTVKQVMGDLVKEIENKAIHC